MGSALKDCWLAMWSVLGGAGVAVGRFVASLFMRPLVHMWLCSSDPRTVLRGLRVARRFRMGCHFPHGPLAGRLCSLSVRFGSDPQVARALVDFPCPADQHLSLLVLFGPPDVCRELLAGGVLWPAPDWWGYEVSVERLCLLADLAAELKLAALARTLTKDPALPASALPKLVGLDEWSNRAVAERSDLDAETVRRLVATDSFFTNLGLARNPHLPDGGYRCLLAGVDPLFAVTVFSGSAVPDWLVEEMLVHSKAGVRKAGGVVARERDSKRLMLAAQIAPSFLGRPDPLSELRDTLAVLV